MDPRQRLGLKETVQQINRHTQASETDLSRNCITTGSLSLNSEASRRWAWLQDGHKLKTVASFTAVSPLIFAQNSLKTDSILI